MPSTNLPYVNAINLIPASGEFTYDTIAYSGQYANAAMAPINTYYAPGGTRTDVMYALDDLQASLPNCQFVAIVVQWMGNSLNAAQCQVYPSSTYIGGAFQPTAGGTDSWRVSDVTLATPGLIAISKPDGIHAAYGGTPSDQSVVRCIQEIKRRGLKVALYLQMNMDAPGQPWRGDCAYTPDLSAQASTIVANFLGAATASMFTPDAVNLTVHYSGSVLDFTYRRFVLHYAWLCVAAGGVNLFTVGSELRGLEAIRGPNWAPAGATDSSGHAIWDYPFVAGLQTLINDCRSIFDGAGLTKNLTTRENLITYSPDWSQWMGAQHAGMIGVFPHLDPLFAMADVDFVSFDNYMPLSDWTTGDGGLDAQNWRAPTPNVWPNPSPQALGFGLTSAPQICDLGYLKGNIEHGEKFDYYYGDYTSATGFDPNSTSVQVTSPQGDRLAQSRSLYYPGQQLFAFKMLRWWWNNPHQAVYDDGDGQGAIPRGPATAWTPQMKSIGFMEYGFPSIDRATNEQNVFYDPSSVASGAPFWCEWEAVEGGGLRPVQDQTLQFMAHQAWQEYWASDGNNETSAAGVAMVATDLMFAWTWDARPFPVFPLRLDIWSDGGNWRAGHWLCGKGPALPPLAPDAPPGPGSYATFPTLNGRGWSVRLSPQWLTGELLHVSGRESRAARRAAPLFAIELDFDLLEMTASGAQLQELLGFFEGQLGQDAPFWFEPPGLSPVSGQAIGIGDGATQSFPLAVSFGAYDFFPPEIGTVVRVYLNGVGQGTSAYSFDASSTPTAITFAAPPPVGSVVTADFHWLLLCRFDDDDQDFEEFMAEFYALCSVKLQSVRVVLSRLPSRSREPI
jgi:uncharacterized protein (TIGR02217 family)